MTPAEEWKRCSGWISAALEYAGGTHTLDDVREAIERGEAHFWPGERSAIVSEFQIYPRLTRFHFWLAGGDMIELLETLRPACEAWAQSLGVNKFSVAGREGWIRAMKKYGYAPAGAYLTKDGV